MNNVVRYSLLRILLFLAALLALWLVGLRNPLLLLLAAATISMVVSLFALSGMREAMSVEVASSVQRRHERGRQRRHDEVLTDEEAEDIEGSGGVESEPYR